MRGGQSGVRSRFIVLAAGIMVLTVLGGAVSTMTGPAGAAAPPRPTRRPSRCPARRPSPRSTPRLPGLVAVPLEPIPVVAELKAMSADRAGVATDSAFVLTSRTAERADTMAARLQVEPAVASRMSPGADTAVIRPVTPLAKGRIYQFTMRAPDEAVQGSWVFVTKQSLHVAGTLPSARATGVPLYAGIEVTFDQDGTSEAPSHFGISPQVAGRFEQHGRTLVFVPQKLREKTVYTVTIRKDLPLDDTDQALEDDVVFSFETAGSGAAEPRPSTLSRSPPWSSRLPQESRRCSPSPTHGAKSRRRSPKCLPSSTASRASQPAWRRHGRSRQCRTGPSGRGVGALFRLRT